MSATRCLLQQSIRLTVLTGAGALSESRSYASSVAQRDYSSCVARLGLSDISCLQLVENQRFTTSVNSAVYHHLYVYRDFSQLPRLSGENREFMNVKHHKLDQKIHINKSLSDSSSRALLIWHRLSGTIAVSHFISKLHLQNSTILILICGFLRQSPIYCECQHVLDDGLLVD